LAAETSMHQREREREREREMCRWEGADGEKRGIE
jgi:hypothetical protein